MGGALVQTVVGFGMGVVSIPLLVWAGWRVPEAIGILLPNVLIHTLVSCWLIRQSLPWSDAVRIFLWRLIGLGLGIGLLWKIDQYGQDIARQILGVGVIGMLFLQQSARHLRWPFSAAALAAVAGIASGATAGLIGMGGPPLVLWVMHQNWPPRRQRGFLWLSFLLVIPVHLPTMYLAFGEEILHAALTGLIASPLVILVARVATAWADRISQPRLRRAMQVFLLLIAIRLMVTRWLGG